MNTAGGALAFDAIITDVSFRSQLDAMERRVLGFSDTTVRETSRVDQSFKRLGQLAAGYFSFNALTQLPAQILKVRGEFQQLEIAFGTMLRSKSKADALLSSLADTAATTPFGLKDIATGAKQLLAYGSSATNVVKEIRMLGDVASGVSAPINELIYLYGTLRTQGRAYAVDIRQFAGRGIPIYAELAKVLGTNVDKVNEFVEGGKVGFKEVEQAFKNMTSSGGLFAGLMDAQSKSLLGLKERLSDAWDLMLNEIGKKNEGVATELLTTANNVVANYQTVIDILKVAAVGYGSYRSALLLVMVAQRAQSVFTRAIAVEQGLAAASGQVLSASQLRLAASTTLLSRAQASLNATMLANPYVLIATALGVLVGYAITYADEAQKIKSAQELMAESSKDVQSSFRRQVGEVNTLIGIIKNQNVAESERLNAYEKLKSVAPDILKGLDFEQAKTAKLTETVNQYITVLRKKLQLESGQSKAKEAYDQQAEAAERLKKAEDELLASKGKNQKIVLGVGGPKGAILAPSESDQAKSRYEEAVRLKKKADKAAADVEESIAKIYAGTATKEEIQANIDKQERVMASLPKLSFGYKVAEEALKGYRKELANVTTAEKQNQTVQGRGIEQIQDEIKNKKKLLLDTNTDAQNAAIRKQIDELEKQERRLTGKKTPAENKAIRDADKVGPLGSLSYYDNVIKKTDEALSKVSKDDTKSINRLLAVKAGAEEKAAEIRRLLETPAGSVKYFDSIASAAQAALEKTPVTNTAAIERQKQIIIDAQAQAEEAKRLIIVRSFDEEIDYKKSQFILYEKWVSAYGKKAADAQFGDLIKSGQSYVEYLNAQISQLENKRTLQGLTPKEVLNLDALNAQRNEATGAKTALEIYRDELGRLREDTKTTASYIDALQKKLAEIPATTSADNIGKRLLVSEDLNAAQRQLQAELTQYLTSITGAEKQRLEITERYASLRAALESKYANKARDAAYNSELAAIDKGQKDELKEVNERATQASDAYKKLDEVILESGRKALTKRLQILNEYLEKEKGAVGTQAYQQKLKERNDLKISLKDDDLTRLGEYAQLVGQLGEAFVEIGGDAANIGETLTALSSSFSLVTEALKASNEGDAAKGFQIALQGAVSLVSMLISASSKRAKADKDYYNAVIAQQQQYNLLLNEQTGLVTQNKGSIFYDDYIGKIADSVNKFDVAQDKYQESLKKLSQGKAKIGIGEAVDWNAVGKGAASGAAIGAALGGPAALITGSIGALIGGAIGLFSKKSAEEFGSLLGSYPDLIQKSKDGVDELNVNLAQTLIDQGLVDDATKQTLQTTIEWQKQVQETKDAVKEVVKTLVGDFGDKLRDNLVNAFKDGQSAALAFKSTLEDLIESVATKILYNQFIGPYLDQFAKDVTASFSPGGDKSIIDDSAKLYKGATEGLGLFNEGMKVLEQTSHDAGFDILRNRPKSGTGNPNSLSGAISGTITENTASVLAGSINSIRITQADSNAQIRKQLLILSGIESNTARIQKTNELLDSVDRTLKVIAQDPTRGLGGLPR